MLTFSQSCVAIHGWGSHPLGGFKAHNDTYMWLRDSLAKDLPQLRVFIYGYACDLSTDDSISGIDDYADTLRRLLRGLRGEDQVKGTLIRLNFSTNCKDGSPSALDIHCP